MIETAPIDNLDDIANDLAEGRDAFREELADSFRLAGRDMRDIFRDKWLSGRFGDDIGLNIRTGRLHDSIQNLTVVNPRSVESNVYNRDADYWRFHPRRFPAEKIFTKEGQKLYTSALQQALEAIA